MASRKISSGLICLWILLTGVTLVEVDAHEWLRVTHVNDGDTVVLADGRRIRYLGIDAPEVAHWQLGVKSKPADPLGPEAEEYNKGLVDQKNVRLEMDREKQDHYGRLLAYVFLENGELVNETMIQHGLAYCLVKAPNIRYRDRFLRAQQKAMDARLGIWCVWKAKKGAFIGNNRSLRFHRAQCIVAPAIKRRHRVTFNSTYAAFYQGYAPCKKCLTLSSFTVNKIR